MTATRVVRLVAILGVVIMLVIVGTTEVARAATIVVNTTADAVADDGQCSLREAITAANTDTASGSISGECPAGTGVDTITLSAGTYTLALTGANEDNNATGDLDISSDLTIDGAGAGATLIDDGGIDRVIHIASGATAAINDVTLTNGSVTVAGGGIYNLLSALTLNNTSVTNNASPFDGVGIHNVGGTLTISGSTISGNSGRNGAGIKNDNSGTLTLTNSTISGNTSGAGDTGGGISNDSTVNITGSTISGNSAGSGGGIFTNIGTISVTNSTFSANSGGGVRADASGIVNMANTIISNTASGADCLGTGTFNSNDNNLDGDGTCNLVATNDQPGVDPLLGPLQNNGGSTLTHALLSGSPAIDAGKDGSAPATDQIGTTRPQGSASDIGAFEVVVVRAAAIPTMSQWGLIGLALAFASVFAWRILAMRDGGAGTRWVRS